MLAALVEVCGARARRWLTEVGASGRGAPCTHAALFPRSRCLHDAATGTMPQLFSPKK
jgi:hypothetical protein